MLRKSPSPALRAPSDTYSKILNLRLPQGAREKLVFLSKQFKPGQFSLLEKCIFPLAPWGEGACKAGEGLVFFKHGNN